MTVIDRHTATASVGGVALALKSARVTTDEGWSPYVQAELVCAAADALALDPRAGVTVQVGLERRFGDSDAAAAISSEFAGKTAADVSAAWAGMTAAQASAPYFRAWNAGEPPRVQSAAFALRLRSRPRSRREDTVTLTLASGEALLQDYAHVAAEAWDPATADIRTIAVLVLQRLGLGLAPGTATGKAEGDPPLWTPGMAAWDYLNPLAQSADLRLWCDRSGVFHLDKGTPTASGTLALSSGGTLVDARDDIDLDGDDFYDAVVVSYTWTDPLTNQSHTKYDTASVGGYRKTKLIEYRDTPYPGPGAATAILSRRLGRGVGMALTAVSDYTAATGQALTVDLSGEPTRTGAVAAVAWSLPSAEMTITPRDLTEN